MPDSPDTAAIAAVRKRLSDWDEKQTQPPTHVEAECPVDGCDECFRGMLLWGTSDIRTLLAALATERRAVKELVYAVEQARMHADKAPNLISHGVANTMIVYSQDWEPLIDALANYHTATS